MDIAVLLIAVLVLGFVVKPRDKKSYHKALIAIFGIAYFCIWRFLDFHAELSHWDESNRHLALAVLMAATVLISVLPWVLRISAVPAIALAGVFIASAVATFGFEKSINNLVAKAGGFYADSPPSSASVMDHPNATRVAHEDGGFTLTVPTNWQERSLAPGLSYFVRMSNDDETAELRPRCSTNQASQSPKW